MPAGVLLASVCDSGWRPRDSLPTGRHQPCLQSQSQQQNLCVASPQNKADRPGGAGATGNRSCYPKGDKLVQGPKAQDRRQMGWPDTWKETATAQKRLEHEPENPTGQSAITGHARRQVGMALRRLCGPAPEAKIGGGS